MKKILSLVTAISLAASCFVCAAAADKEKGEPDVYVDGSRIIFEDQNATIVDGRTLVPARGVFEAMECKVEWDADARAVTVTSSTGVQSVVITIDSDKMRILKFKSLMERTENEITIDVPAQIMNDRTMIPLRAVSEAFDCNVEWDSENYKVDITTGDPILLEGYTYSAPDEDKLVSMSLSTDKTGAIEAGEEFIVYIDATNIPDGMFCNGVTAVIEYDKSKFSYVEESCTLINNNDEPYEGVGSVAADYETGISFSYVTIEENIARNTDGHVFSLKFKSIDGSEGEFALGKQFINVFGYESYLGFGKEGKTTEYSGKDLIIGAPITIGE